MHLDDGGDELLQEVVAQQRRPVVVDEVDQKALDAEDLNDAVDLGVLHDLTRRNGQCDPRPFAGAHAAIEPIVTKRFGLTCLSVASRTLSIFPLRGKTP
ncbi:hypothetical protein EYF80_024454 [Liparis tanakae]|uniref:Uncharacterized protein n=1 Tax=Liparis tanakae TaxID=230148 RepID=A0A4Z2HID8_9TELE|nr:hypothetical protein EYF80_024454 [Liparis tanakae]